MIEGGNCSKEFEFGKSSQLGSSHLVAYLDRD